MITVRLTWHMRRVRGPPEVAHHRPTFPTSGLALSYVPRSLFVVPCSLARILRVSSFSAVQALIKGRAIQLRTLSLKKNTFYLTNMTSQFSHEK